MLSSNTCEIELQDAGGTSWWAGILAMLPQGGNAYMRFTARPEGGKAYSSETFPCPRTLGAVDPEEKWAPGMTKALDDLRRELQADGWVESGRGEHAWSYRYTR